MQKHHKRCWNVTRLDSKSRITRSARLQPMRKNSMKKIFVSGFLVLSVVNIAMAASVPHRIAADSHIKVVQYDPNNVVLLSGQYGYQTQITFAPNEIVQNVSLGDSVAWQAVPVSN